MVCNSFECELTAASGLPTPLGSISTRGDSPEKRMRETKMRRPACVSLFSGAGGLDLGLELAGWSTAYASDKDRDAVATLKSNLGRPLSHGRGAFEDAYIERADVTTLTGQDVLDRSRPSSRRSGASGWRAALPVLEQRRTSIGLFRSAWPIVRRFRADRQPGRCPLAANGERARPADGAGPGWSAGIGASPHQAGALACRVSDHRLAAERGGFRRAAKAGALVHSGFQDRRSAKVPNADTCETVRPGGCARMGAAIASPGLRQRSGG